MPAPRILLLLLLFFTGISGAFSQEGPALTMKVETRIINQDEAVDWSNLTTHEVVDGRPVVVRIDGDNFRLRVTLTAFLQSDDLALLVAKTEVIHQDQSVSGTRQSVQTQQIKLGTPLLFYPLGKNSRSQEGHRMIMEILVAKL